MRVEYSFRKRWRSARVSLWSAASSCENCTGAAVWLAGTVSPDSKVSVLGVPGFRSTK